MANKKEVWDEFSSLYHYTNQAGLLGILSSNNLWATSYKFMNDATEISHFRALASKFLEPEFRKISSELESSNDEAREKVSSFGGLDDVVEHELQVFLDTLYNTTFHRRENAEELVHPFILSLCGHEDEYERDNGLLSQWRGYGAGGGFAIEFDTRALSDIVAAQVRYFRYYVAHFSDVVYGQGADAIRSLSTELNMLKSAVQRFYDGDASCFDELYHPFTSLATRTKHFGFREENEVRIVLAPALKNGPKVFGSHRDHEYKPVLTRQGPLGPVAYIELIEDGSVELPIKRIIVGPSRYQERNFEAAKFALGGRNVQLIRSHTPYVG